MADRKSKPLIEWPFHPTKGINSATGGTDFMPGAWSPTPDQLDFVIGQITGGVGREALKATQVVAAKFTGDELPAQPSLFDD